MSSNRKQRQELHSRRWYASVVHSLACGKTAAEAARQAGIAEETISRNMGELRPAIQAKRDEIMDRIVGRYVDLQTVSVEVQRQLMTGAKSESVKLAAAKSIAELAIKLRETQELVKDIRKLLEDRESQGDSTKAEE